jgi:hypothetical protein
MYIIPKNLKEEYKMFDKPRIWLKDVKTSAVLMGIYLIFQNGVHSWLKIPFWITAILAGFYLIQPAKSNPKKRNWEAILFLIGKDHETYYSINHIQEQEKEG